MGEPDLERTMSADIKPRVSALNLPVLWEKSKADPFEPRFPIIGNSPDNLEALFNLYPPVPTDEIGISATLRHMEWRSFIRRYLGAHKRTWQPITAVALTLFGGMMTYTTFGVACSPQERAREFYLSLGALTGMALWLLFITKTPLAFRLICYTASCVVVVNFVTLIAITAYNTEGNTTLNSGQVYFPYSKCSSQLVSRIGYTTALGLIVFQVLTLGVDLLWSHFVNRIGCYYYKKSNLFVSGWRLETAKYTIFLTPAEQTLEPMAPYAGPQQKFKAVKGVQVVYRGVFLFERFWRRLKQCARCSRRPKLNLVEASSAYPWRVSYTGQIDASGRPSGFGYWQGDALNGESLVGYWIDGRPSGPYKSREVSGSGLMCLTLGWIKHTSEKVPLSFGISHLECSVSGQFFKCFPEARLREAPMRQIVPHGLLREARRKLGVMINRTKKVVVGGRPRSLTIQATPGDPQLFHAPRSESEDCLANFRSESLTKSVSGVEKTGRKNSLVVASQEEGLSSDSEFDTTLVGDFRWILNELHPHTPNFGIQPRSEICISVDPERGVDIMGFVPLAQLAPGGANGKTDPLLSPRGVASSRKSLAVRVLENPLLQWSGSQEQGMDDQCQTFEKQIGEIYAPELMIEGWTPMDSIGVAEILLYIHGYNNSLAESLKTLGQMVAFGNFPPHLKTIVFSWPAGHGLFSFNKARAVAESSAAHEALEKALTSLQLNGIRQVHILCHSMGTRLFLKAFRKISAKNHLFDVIRDVSPPSGPQAISNARMDLVTCTFLNPEYFLDEFLDQDYEILRRRCSNITIYADGNDQALWWSEMFSRRESLGRSVFGLRVHRDKQMGIFPQEAPNRPSMEDKIASERSLSMSEKVADNWDQTFGVKLIHPDVEVMRRRLRCLHTMSFFHLDGSAEDAKSKNYQRRRLWDRLFNRRLNQTAQGDWLDVDIIDTTFMDQNVHGLRHSFWNLNREVIEDLRECLVTRKRARQRAGRLDRRDGNVWVFRVAPSFLTSIFS